MKNPAAAGLVTLLAATAFALAQIPAVTAPVLSYIGEVVSVSLQSSAIVIASKGDKPLSYHYTGKTRFSDAAGNIVTPAAVHPGMTVRADYSFDGDVRRVDRVYIQSEKSAATVETTTSGTKTTTTVTTHSK